MPHSAPATTDVVARGGSAAWIATLSPASARQIALVSPLTPAPITNASSLGVFTPKRYSVPSGPCLARDLAIYPFDNVLQGLAKTDNMFYR